MYRDLQGRFDKIVSVGMFEHVGILSARLRRWLPLRAIYTGPYHAFTRVPQIEDLRFC